MSDLEPLAEVVPITNVGYAVRSKSEPGAYRIVRGGECSCPGFESRGHCRHQRIVAEFCAEQNRRLARPVMAPNVSALVD